MHPFELDLATGVRRFMLLKNELEWRIRFERLIAEMSTNFINLAAEEVDQGIYDALKAIGEFVGVDRSYVSLFSDDRTKVSNTHEWCADGIESLVKNSQNIPIHPMWTKIAEQFEQSGALYIPRTADIPPELQDARVFLEAQRIQSLVTVNMLYSGTVIGAVGFDSVRSLRIWTGESITLLKIVGEMMANALMRKRADEQIAERNRQLMGLNAISRTISQSLDMNDILNSVIDKTLKMLNLTHGFIIFQAIEGDFTITQAVLKMGDKYLNPVVPHSIAKAIVERFDQSSDEAILEPLNASMHLISAMIPDGEISGSLDTVIHVPLKTKGKALGMMCVFSSAERGFSPEDRHFLVTIGHAVTTGIENAVLYEELQRRKATIEDALRHSIMAQEEERHRIARELHDQTSQILTGVSAKIQAAMNDLSLASPSVTSRLEEVQLSLTEMLGDIRGIIYELRPTVLDDLGLAAAVRSHTARHLERAGIRASFDVSGSKRRLPSEVEVALFRIIQEATTNVVRHAAAESIHIKLEFAENVVLLDIKDDGKGFDFQEVKDPKLKKRGMGLVNMRERSEILGGTFGINSQHGIGTRIKVEIPLE
jgi:signal transduction histidine kinase